MRWRFIVEKKKKPEKRGPFTFFKDGKTRAQNWQTITTNRRKLVDIAEELRKSSAREILQAATLVDAAIETLDEAAVVQAKPDEE